MSQSVAVRVSHLGKQYRLGATQASYNTFRDAIIQTATLPVRALGRVLRPSSAPSQRTLFWALQDVSFQVQQGEAIGIIGSNGAGKSTLLKILSRITDPSAGRVEVYGRVGSLLEVGTGFHPELTGRENVYLNGAILGMRRSEIARKFDEIVAFAEVEKFIDTAVKHYSSGMYLRLAFAVAAHLEPEILVVDEVLAVGDSHFQKKCMNKMSDVAHEGRTILFVSHNMQAITSLCSSAIVLNAGQLVFQGTAQEAVALYLQQSQDASQLYTDLRTARRKSNPKAIFESIQITSGQGESRFPKTGEDVQIAVQIRCFEPIRDASVCVVIWDSAGGRVIDANTRMAGQDVTLSQGDVGIWTFCLRDVLLRPAFYRIEAYIGDVYLGGIDYLPNALTFEVQMNPEYPMGTVDYPGSYRCQFEVQYYPAEQAVERSV